MFTYAEGYGLRRLAAAFLKASLLAACFQSLPASKLAGRRREQAPALQNRRDHTSTNLRRTTLECRQQGRQQRSATRKLANQYMFVKGVRAVPHSTQTVQSGDAERG